MAVYGVGGLAAIDGSLDIGTLVALAFYLTRFYAPLTALSGANAEAASAAVAFRRVAEVLALDPAPTRAVGRSSFPRAPFRWRRAGSGSPTARRPRR